MLVRSDLRIEAMYVEGGEDVFMMYCCTKRMRKFSIANMMTSDWEDSKVHFRHRSGTLEAQEEVTQCKTEKEDEKKVCARNMKMKLGQDEGYP